MSRDVKHLSRITQTIHAGQYADEATGAVAPPIFQTSTFAFTDCAQGADRFAGAAEGYIYTRMGNPTIARLEEAVSTLEQGHGGLATGSGMAALTTTLFAVLNRGDHMVGTSSVYGPSRVVVERDFSRFGVESTFVDTSDLDAVRAAIRPETKLVFVETPANPTIVMTDIAAVAEIAHEHGALLLVDNTFASPILQRPLELGADIVMHSMTKFINGHTDVVAGMIVPKTEALFKKIRSVHFYVGACMDPHQAWLALRGFKTLGLRVHAAQEGARKLAQWLEYHDKIASDGRSGFVDLLRGQGGIRCRRSIAELGQTDDAGGFTRRDREPDSASVEHDSRRDAWITDGLVRLSVGCEDVEDLIADLEQALARV